MILGIGVVLRTVKYTQALNSGGGAANARTIPFPIFIFYGGCSSVGRALGCDPECRRFKSGQSPLSVKKRAPPQKP